MNLPKRFRRLISFIVSFTLLFQTFAPTLVLAQEITPEPTPTETASPSLEISPTPTISEAPTPTVEAVPTVEPIITQEATPEPTPTETASPSPEISPTPPPEVTPESEQGETPLSGAISPPTPVPTLAPLWNDIDSDTIVTNDLVGEGIDYRYRDSDLLIRFTKITTPGNLTIKQIKLTPEQVAATGALSDIAYDIISDMENGSFLYDLTLPLPEDSQNAKVEFASDQSSLGQSQEISINVTKNQDSIVIKGLDHFTVFFVTSGEDRATIETCDSDGDGDSDGEDDINCSIDTEKLPSLESLDESYFEMNSFLEGELPFWGDMGYSDDRYMQFNFSPDLEADEINNPRLKIVYRTNEIDGDDFGAKVVVSGDDDFDEETDFTAQVTPDPTKPDTDQSFTIDLPEEYWDSEVLNNLKIRFYLYGTATSDDGVITSFNQVTLIIPPATPLEIGWTSENPPVGSDYLEGTDFTNFKTCGDTLNYSPMTNLWQPVDGAAGYDREVYSPEETLVYSHSVSANYVNGGGAVNGSTYYVRIRAYDEGGNRGDWSQKCAVTYDTTAPTILYDSYVNPTNNTTPTLSGIATDTGGSNTAWVEYRVDGGVWTPAVPNDGAFDSTSETFEITPGPLVEGPHDIDLRSADSAGNIQTEMVSLSLTTDYTPPATPSLVDPANGAAVPPTGLVLDWTDSPDQSGPVTYKYKSSWTGGNYGPVSTGTNSRINAGGSLDRVYSWQVQACDAVNNCSAWSGPWTVIIDGTKPTAPGAPHSTPNPTNQPTQTWNWTGSADSLSGVKGYWYQVVGPIATPWTYLSDVLSVATSLPEGNSELSVLAEDNAGNQGASSSGTLTVDRTPPAAPDLISPANGLVTRGDMLTNRWSTVSDAITYTYESYHNAAGTNLRWRQTINAPTTQKSASNVPDATFWWRVRAIDAAGNESEWSPLWQVIVDNTRPALTGKTEFSGWYNSDQESEFFYADQNGIVSGLPVTCTISPEGENQTCSAIPNVCDAAGNCNNSLVTSNGANIDKTTPEIISLETQDNNRNGKIDAIKITFSENIDDSRLVEGPDGWAVEDYDEPSIETGETVNDNILILGFLEGADFDTAATPTVIYEPSGELDLTSTHDQSGNELADFKGVAIDKAPPVLVSAITDDNDLDGRIDRIVATLSEDINGSSSTPADYQVDGYDIASELESGGVVTLVLVENETGNDTGAKPQVSLISGESSGVEDLADNWSYGDKSVEAADGAAPVSTLSTPTQETYHNSAINISGSSSDSNGESLPETVDFVTLSYRVNDGVWVEINRLSNEEGGEPFEWSYDWTPESDGTYDIKAAATDTDGNQEGSDIVTGIVYDTANPTIEYTEDSPSDGLITNEGRRTFSVSVNESVQSCTLNFTGNYGERRIENGLSDGSGFTGLVYADDSAVNYALPFTFPFFGNSYNRLSVSTNALLNFASTYDPEYPGSSDRLRTGKTGIATAWTDLVTQLSARAVADNVRFRWNGYGWGTGGYITNEAVLRSNGTVELHYGDVNVRRALTIGLSAGNGTDYVFSSLNGASVISPISYAYSPGNSGSYPMALSGGEGNKYTVTVDPMPEGVTNYSVSCTDLASNSADSVQRSITVDTVSPTGEITYSTTEYTNGTVTATLNPSETVTVTNNGGLSNYIFSANGSFEFTFTDSAGNIGSATATVENIDTTDPESVITLPENDGTGNTVYTNDWDGRIEGTASDNLSGLVRVELSIQRATDSAYWNGDDWVIPEGEADEPRVIADGTESWNYSLPEGIDEDSYQIVSHAVDIADNIEDSYELTVVLDKTIPEVAISLDPATPDSGNNWYKTEPTITLTATDNTVTDYIQYQWDSTSGSWTIYDLPFKTIGEGNHTLYYRAFDKAGNVSGTGIKNIKYDKENLTNGALNVSVSPNPTSGTTAKVKWEAASDNVGIEKYEVNWSLDGTATSYTDTVGNEIREHEINNLDHEGKWNITVTALDYAGNKKSGSTELNVDRSAPIPPTLTLGGTGVGSATFNWNKISDAVDYIIWYGNISGIYLYGARTGNTDNFTVRGLGAGDYFFVIQSVDNAGNRSGNSNEINTFRLVGAPGVEPGTPAEGFTPEVKGAETSPTPTPTETSSVLGAVKDWDLPWWLIFLLIPSGGLLLWSFLRRP